MINIDKILLFVSLLAILSSCSIGDQNLVWYGEEEVSYEAHKVIFRPDKPVNVTFLTIGAISYSEYLYDSCTIDTEEVIICDDSEKVKIDENGKQRIESDWFTVYQDYPDIIIEITECSCPARSLTIVFDDTVTTGTQSISLLQRGKD